MIDKKTLSEMFKCYWHKKSRNMHNKIRINNWDNFFLLWEMDAFKLHKPRKSKLINGFRRNQQTQKLLLLKNLRNPQTLNNLSHHLTKRTLQMHFTNFYETGLADRKRIFNKNGSWYYIWLITPQGEKIFKKLNFGAHYGL